MIRGIKTSLRRFGATPELEPTIHLKAIMELTRKKIFLENLDKEDNNGPLDDLRNTTSQQLKELGLKVL